MLSPPPRLSPAIPVRETTPSGVASSTAARRRTGSPSSRPAPARTVRSAGNDLHGLHRRQVQYQAAVATALPATLWPPPLADRRRSWRLATPIPRTTSDVS